MKLLTNGIFLKGGCLNCGGDVNVLNNGADGICSRCGPLSFDVQVRNGEHVEGFSVEAWREIETNKRLGINNEDSWSVHSE